MALNSNCDLALLKHSTLLNLHFQQTHCYFAFHFLTCSELEHVSITLQASFYWLEDTVRHILYIHTLIASFYWLEDIVRHILYIHTLIASFYWLEDIVRHILYIHTLIASFYWLEDIVRHILYIHTLIASFFSSVILPGPFCALPTDS